MHNNSFRRQTALDTIHYAGKLVWNWTHSNLHLVHQTYCVIDFMRIHKVGYSAIDAHHPWATGISPHTGKLIWTDNIIFASPRKSSWLGLPPEDDHVIAIKIGSFLSAMVRKSTTATDDIEQGPKRRMPHAVNLLHGSTHFNGGYMLFNDYQDAMFHISDTNFVKEMARFAREEKRELTIVLREREYNPEEYAWFVAFIRSHLPWYANGNGPTKRRVLTGTPSPYPAVNPINGSWVHDVWNVYRRNEAIVRPPIEKKYFQGKYRGYQKEFTFLERFHAWAMGLITHAKGFQGGLVFTKREVIEPENLKKYQETHGKWRASYSIGHPFMRIDTARQSRVRRPDCSN